MIVARLKGGLGNQLFQYAFGRALALSRQDDMELDLTALLDRYPQKGLVFRDYDLDIFDIQPRFTSLSKLAKLLPLPLAYSRLSYAAVQVKRRGGYVTLLRDRDLERGVKYLDRRGDLYLNGYWQSVDHFKDAEPILRKDLVFRDKLKDKTLDLEEEIRGRNSVCVDVRRSDYLKPNSGFNFIGLDYYDRASQLMAAKESECHAYVFSDEPDWARENLKLPFPTTWVPNELAGRKFGDKLRLMSSCRNFIISNSTFAWWAAWLNADPQKVVIAPANWFNNVPRSFNIVPDEWLKI